MHIHDGYLSIPSQNENLYPIMNEDVTQKVFKIKLYRLILVTQLEEDKIITTKADMVF